MYSMRYRTLAALAAVAALGACKPGDRGAASDTGAMARAGDTMAARTDTAANRMGAAMDSARPRGDWTDARVMGFATVANNGEIQENQLAARKATNAAVKAFATQMVTDHRAMLAEGKALGTKLNVTADTAWNDAHDLANKGRDELKDMNDKKAGKDWDEDFIEHQIDTHKDVLDKLQDAAKNSNNAEIRAMLEKATAKVQQHLTKAQDIKANSLKT